MYKQYYVNPIKDEDESDVKSYVLCNKIASIKYITEEKFNKLITKYGVTCINCINDLDERIAMKYVDKYPKLIKFIRNKNITKELFKKIINKYGANYINYIKDLSEQIAMRYVNKYPKLIKFIKSKNITIEIYEEALRKYPFTLNLIENPTIEMLKCSMRLDKNKWTEVKKITYNIYKYLLNFENINFRMKHHNSYDDNIWENITYCDIKRNSSIIFIILRKKNIKAHLLLLKISPMYLLHISKSYVTLDICKHIVKKNGKNIIYVPYLYMTEELCKMAIDNGASLEIIDGYFHTLKLCVYCLKKDINNINFIKNKYVLDILNIFN